MIEPNSRVPELNESILPRLENLIHHLDLLAHPFNVQTLREILLDAIDFDNLDYATFEFVTESLKWRIDLHVPKTGELTAMEVRSLQAFSLARDIIADLPIPYVLTNVRPD